MFSFSNGSRKQNSVLKITFKLRFTEKQIRLGLMKTVVLD